MRLNPFAKDLSGSAARTALAVYLADQLPEEYRELAKALIVVAIGFWSMYTKYVTRQKLETAKASTVPMSEATLTAVIAAGNASPVLTAAVKVPTQITTGAV